MVNLLDGIHVRSWFIISQMEATRANIHLTHSDACSSSVIIAKKCAHDRIHHNRHVTNVTGLTLRKKATAKMALG